MIVATRCALCLRAIPGEYVEDLICHGCHAAICPDHPADPLGLHAAEEHNFAPGDFD